MGDTRDTLLVRHLPSELDEDEVIELLSHFGARNVRCMGVKGRLKHCAFATFSDHSEASKGLKRLHQLSVLKNTLSAEFAKPQHAKHHPNLLDDPKFTSPEESDTKSDTSAKEQANLKFREKQLQFLEELNSVCSKWGVVHPLNSKLEYMYPAPTVSILTNIANALASHPPFYVQVLHLMNKMNLPPPFGPVTTSPPLAEDHVTSDTTAQVGVTKPDDMTITSSEESELESDSEVAKTLQTASPKRPREQSKRARKKHKLQPILPVVKTNTLHTGVKVDEIFEQPQSQQTQKKIELKLSNVGTLDSNVRSVSRGQSENDTQIQSVSTNPPTDLLGLVENKDTGDVGGFGKIEPVAKDISEEKLDKEEDGFRETEFITFKELKEGRLSSEQMKEFSVFKSYSSGEPTTRLYIKNLAKQTTEQDLHRIFGRYIDWSSEEEEIMFDIRLMKEGRMKGQAFITLANEEAAVFAVNETNGFVLNSKPMVVQFARSAKPKEKDSGTK